MTSVNDTDITFLMRNENGVVLHAVVGIYESSSREVGRLTVAVVYAFERGEKKEVHMNYWSIW